MAERDPDCIFCKIIAGEIPSSRIYEDEMVLAFMDVNPLAGGHVLVIPKGHYPRATDIDAESMAAVGAVLPRLSRAVMAATGADGFNLYQTNGRCAGQSVDHVHVHIIPRMPGDGLGINWNSAKYAEGDLEAWHGKIVDALE